MSIQIRGSSGNILDVDANGRMLIAESEGKTLMGVYGVNSGVITPSSGAQNGTSSQVLALYNPSASGVIAAIERIQIMSQLSATSTATLSATRYGVQRIAHTAAPGSNLQSPSSMDSTYQTPTCIVGSTTAGTNQTLVGGVCWATYMVTTYGTAGWTFLNPSNDLWIPRESEYEFVIRGGEGIVIYQIDAAVGTDVRRVSINIVWEEYTVA